MGTINFKRYHTIFGGKKLSWNIYDAVKKPSLVLLHGFCEDAGIWEAVVNNLAGNFHLIVPDLPGFGESEVQDNQSMESMADAVKYILDESSVSEPVMVGHSMGGYITLAFVSKYPGLLKGFGLFHSTAWPDTDEKKENRLKTVEFIQTNGSEPFARVLIPSLYAPQAPKALLAQAMERGSRCTPEGLSAAAIAMRNRPDYTKVLKESSIPLLMVAGRFDAGIPVSTSALQASLSANASFYILESSGHSGMLEESDKSAEILQEFTNHCQLYTNEN